MTPNQGLVRLSWDMLGSTTRHSQTVGEPLVKRGTLTHGPQAENKG